MPELSSRDYINILQGIEQVHAETTLPALQRRMMRVVESLVPCAHLSYNELDAVHGRAYSFFNSDSFERATATYLPVFEQLMSDHPVLRLVTHNGRTGRATAATKITDLVLQRDYLRSPLFNECYRHLDTHYQLILPLSFDGAVIGIAVNRDTSDFTERDRAIIETLRPHFCVAHRRLAERTRVATLFGATREEAGIDILRTLGLTRQQARVLFWVLQGKTTPEIATILTSSPRTVQKHLEHVYLRLDVSTRTAAINRVMERLLDIG